MGARRSSLGYSCPLFLAAMLMCMAEPARAQRAAVFPGAEWEVSTPEAEGMDPTKFAAAMANMPATAIVIRNGKIIAIKGDIARPGPLYSGSKALLATLAALLMHQAKITMDTLVPSSDVPTPPLASIRHFLTMTSDYYLTPHNPGEHYAYSNSGAIRYGEYLIHTFYPGLTEIQALRNAYLDRLGIQDPFDLVGAISGWGGGGFVMSTRDYARLGYLILRGGVWNGERLLPQWFVDGLYVNQIPATATAGGTGRGEVDNQVNVTPRMPGTYSWGWWIPHGRAGYEGSRSTTIACTATGSFGTSMHVIPQFDMILASVNTVSTMAGGRISGALIDQFAAAVVTNNAPAPVITAVVNGASFGPGLSPGSWISIFGSNLAPGSRIWRDTEISNGNLPTALDGVSVTVAGQSAAVYYISPNQLNVQVPDGALGSTVPVQVATPAGTATAAAGIQQFAPGFFAYDAENRRYAAAQHGDYSTIAREGLYPGATPARPGETIVVYGTGFGPTTPHAPAGHVLLQAAPLANDVRVWIGNVPATVSWSGLSAAGLYQLNVIVPETLPDGDAAIVAEIGGVRTQEGAHIAVRH